ncbi:hypothetical protein HYY75_05110 [bacterium]|nr:hypothetical protein [bacterium]
MDFSFRLIPERRAVNIEIDNPTEKQFVINYFKRGGPLIMLLIFEDGTLIKDARWKKPYKGPLLRDTYYDGHVLNIDSKRRSLYSVDLSKRDLRFDLSKNGTYFIVCIMKKHGDITKGFWKSNILTLEVKDWEITSAKEIDSKGIPQAIESVFESEMRSLIEEETK